MIINEFNGFFENIFCDVRLQSRAEKVMHDMLIFGKSVVNKFCNNSTDKIGAYRMFNNESFNYIDLAKGLYRSCIGNQGSNHLLCIQDTTEFNYTHHKERLRSQDNDIGPVTKKGCVGFFCHPMLVVDPVTKMPMGVSSVELWNRENDQPTKHERAYNNLAIKDKESYRWIRSASRTKRLLSKTPTLTIIGDRESDIYEELILVPDTKTHLLIRSSINRCLYDSEQKLFERLESLSLQASYDLDITGNKSRTARKAKMSLKYTKVKIKRPENSTKKGYPPYVELWAIEAREKPESVPSGESAILWRILTTHFIENVEDAKIYLQWYSNRWLIEELFRVIKSKGFDLESVQMETGAALKKITVMTLQLALTTMVLKLCFDNQENIQAEQFFTKEQVNFMTVLIKTIEGKTKKQKNPYSQRSLAWASWNIARLGSWSGYISQGPPGYITIKSGLDRFFLKYQGFKLALEMFQKDVYKD